MFYAGHSFSELRRDLSTSLGYIYIYKIDLLHALLFGQIHQEVERRRPRSKTFCPPRLKNGFVGLVRRACRIAETVT